IRKEYPLIEVNNLETFEIRMDKGTPETIRDTKKAWHFFTADRNWGAVVEQNQILVHTKSYTRFNQFAERVEYLLRAMQQSIQPSHYIGSSIRYIDLVAPESGEKLSDYLSDHMFLRQIDGVAGHQVDAISASSFKTSQGELAVRCWLNPAQPLPPDVSALAHAMKFEIKRPANDFAVLDTDHNELTGDPKEFDISRIINVLDSLHQVSRKVFEGIPTQHAFDVWQPENRK
ncbi:MAG TPA: TIGR04255 family protein, partial [Clostridia bacterium]|nr:TIGR04255 family protein [Clostridia bacterium]